MSEPHIELIYTNDQLLMVNHVKNLLETANIESELKNEFIGGAAGDLSPFDTWPELWVEKKDAERAKIVLAQMNDESKLVWFCSKCDEENPTTFDICWQCETVKEI